MSLGGLAVAIGLIIDDTVVVIENIARHLTPDQTKNKTCDPVDSASGEITGAVIGSTLTTVLVFVPLAFISGVYGQFFASLSWALVDCSACLDGYQPEYRSRIRGQVSRKPTNARTRANLPASGQYL